MGNGELPTKCSVCYDLWVGLFFLVASPGEDHCVIPYSRSCEEKNKVDQIILTFQNTSTWGRCNLYKAKQNAKDSSQVVVMRSRRITI